jgi:hypothetical protein
MISTNQSMRIDREKSYGAETYKIYQNNRNSNQRKYVSPLKLFKAEIRKDGTKYFRTYPRRKIPIGSLSSKDNNLIRGKRVRRSFRINVIRLSLERKKLELVLKEVVIKNQILPKEIIYSIKDFLF